MDEAALRRREAEWRSGRRTHEGGATTVRVASPAQTAEPTFDRCAEAKRFREAERRRRGMNITYDQIVWLDDYVREACR